MFGRARIRELEEQLRLCQERSDARVDKLLDRLQVAENLELRPIAPVAPEPKSRDERPYISDLPYDDERWNDTVGEPVEE